MANYDSPDFRGATPGFPGGFDQRSGTAHGSPGITAAEDAPALADVEIRGPYQSAQVLGDRVTVNVGDTDSMSSDAPAPASGDPLTGLSQEQVIGTGAGLGNVAFAHPRYPWQAEPGGPGLDTQVHAARRGRAR